MAIPTRQRIRRSAEFRQVFARGKRTSGAYLSLAGMRNGRPVSRFGLSVGKRVGHAVARNRVKRRIRHALVGMDVARGWDVVVTAKPQASGVSYGALNEAVRRSLKQLGIPVAGRERSGDGPETYNPKSGKPESVGAAE